MKKVYGNMQINFDHIFVLSLWTMPTFKVCPSYLKTLIYKNVRELRFLKGLNLHPELRSELSTYPKLNSKSLETMALASLIQD